LDSKLTCREPDRDVVNRRWGKDGQLGKFKKKSAGTGKEVSQVSETGLQRGCSQASFIGFPEKAPQKVELMRSCHEMQRL